MFVLRVLVFDCVFCLSWCGLLLIVVLLGIRFVDLVAGWWLVGGGLWCRFCLLLYLYT